MYIKQKTLAFAGVQAIYRNRSVYAAKVFAELLPQRLNSSVSNITCTPAPQKYNQFSFHQNIFSKKIRNP